jgi:hypothetical protein
MSGLYAITAGMAFAFGGYLFVELAYIVVMYPQNRANLLKVFGRMLFAGFNFGIGIYMAAAL